MAPHARRVSAAALAGVAPAVAQASDFTGLGYLMVGLASILAIVLALLAWALTRDRGRFAKAFAWGTLLALIVTPGGVLADGYEGPPLLWLMLAGLDPGSADAAKFVELVIGVPACIAAVALLLWMFAALDRWFDAGD